MIGSMWPQECKPFGLVEENGGTPPVPLVEFRPMAVVTLAWGVPEGHLVVKQDDAVLTETWECLRKTFLEFIWCNL